MDEQEADELADSPAHHPDDDAADEPTDADHGEGLVPREVAALERHLGQA